MSYLIQYSEILYLLSCFNERNLLTAYLKPLNTVIVRLFFYKFFKILKDLKDKLHF